MSEPSDPIELVIASANPDKVAEIAAILGPGIVLGQFTTPPWE